MIYNGYPWRKSKKESFTAHYKLISHAPFRIKKKQHSPMWSFFLQRLCDQQVQVNSAWLYFKASLLTFCSWHHTWLIIFTWRTSSSSAQNLENVLRTFARERFFITLIFKPLNSCVSRALKDNNGFTCWIRLKGIIYSSQLTSLPRSFESKTNAQI